MATVYIQNLDRILLVDEEIGKALWTSLHSINIAYLELSYAGWDFTNTINTKAISVNDNTINTKLISVNDFILNSTAIPYSEDILSTIKQDYPELLI